MKGGLVGSLNSHNAPNDGKRAGNEERNKQCQCLLCTVIVAKVANVIMFMSMLFFNSQNSAVSYSITLLVLPDWLSGLNSITSRVSQEQTPLFFSNQSLNRITI